MAETPRDREDLCPGALRLFPASDGGIGRVRFPGGAVPIGAWGTLADMADTWGDGDIHLTTRGNVQIRGIIDAEGFAAAVRDAGLLPHPTHERVRNIAVSPLTGRSGGLADMRPIVEEFDALLCATPECAGLSGRTLFVFDDGRGDVAGFAPDIGFIARDGDSAELLLAGATTGYIVPLAEAARIGVRAARELAAMRGTAWRLSEIPDGAERLLDVLGAAGTATDRARILPATAPIGWIDTDDGRVALGAGLRFAMLDSRLARFLSEVGTPTTVTPWRTIVLHDLDEHVAETVVRVLAPLGLIFDAESTWLRVSACTGLPGCARSTADVRADAAGDIARGRVTPGVLVHYSGCERRCGLPRGDVEDRLATAPDSYTVTAAAAH